MVDKEINHDLIANILGVPVEVLLSKKNVDPKEVSTPFPDSETLSHVFCKGCGGYSLADAEMLKSFGIEYTEDQIGKFFVETVGCPLCCPDGLFFRGPRKIELP